MAFKKRTPRAWLAIAAALALAASPVVAADSFRVVQEGIAVELELEQLTPGPLRENEDVVFRFRIEDTTTGLPLPGLFPAAWMDVVRDGDGPDPKLCSEKIEEFAGGSILTRSELDLNVYYVLALNHDSSVTVVDPQFGYGDTKLLALVRMSSPGEDWSLDADGRRLFVSLPASDAVAVIDTGDWRLETEVGVGPAPGDVALQPDGAYLWVALDGIGEGGEAGEGAGVAVLDVRSLEVVAQLPSDPGPHEIAFSDDNRFAFVANRGGNTVSVIDIAGLRVASRLETGPEPASIAWSPLARAAYVTHAGDGSIVAVDGHAGRVAARVEPATEVRTQRGLGSIRFAPGGRYAISVNPRTDQLHVIDVATNRLIQTGVMERGPDQITFSDELAYIRHRGSEIVLMVTLEEVGEVGGAVHVADFSGGQAAFGLGQTPSRADAIVRAPGAVAVLVANPADKAIYYYKEGMAAPMGQFHNYDREPRAVLALDRSLTEKKETGVYETTARLREPGLYEIAFYLETPRIVHCFRAEVAPDPELEAARLAARPAAVEPLGLDSTFVAGAPIDLKFRLTDPASGTPWTGLGDVQVLAYSSTNWQQRGIARELGDGVYGISVAFPEPGAYFISLATATGRLEFHESPRARVQVVAAATADSPGSR